MSDSTDPERITEKRQAEWDEQDAEVARIQQTVVPKSDAPNRAGITGGGSGADGQGV